MAKQLHFVTEPFPPFNFTENGKISGPIYTILHEACTRGRHTCKFEIEPWRRAYANAQAGKYTGIYSIGKSADREKWMYYSEPLIESSLGMFVSSSQQSNISKLNDLHEYHFIVYGPSKSSQVLEKEILPSLKNNKGFTMEVGPKTPFKKFLANRYSLEHSNVAIFFNREFGKHLIKIMNIKNLSYAYDYKKLYYYVGFPKKSMSKTNFDEFNKSINAVMADKAFIDKVHHQYKIPLVPNLND